MSPVARSKLLSDNIHSRVPKALCSIKVLWNNNTEIEAQLKRFLLLTGISWNDAVSKCN